MDFSAIDTAVSNLEKSLKCLEVWLAITTGLVVLGLVIECFHEIPDALHKIRRLAKFSLKPVCIIAGTALITVGVSGELVVQFLASGKETLLRDANNAKFADLNGKAAAENLRAEQLEAENIKLRQIIQPRYLTPEQRADIAATLTKYSGRKINVSSGSYDHEAYFFSQYILAALRRAKLDVVDDSGKSLDSRAARLTGIRIIASDSQRDVAEAIRKALIEKGGILEKDISVTKELAVIIMPNNVRVPDKRPSLRLIVLGKPLPKIE